MSDNTMLAYFMIAISIALIIGSWMWLAPSVHQKKIARLRQKALEAGFRVKFVKRESYLEFAKPYAKKQTIPDTQIVRYSYTAQENAGLSAKKPAQKLLLLFNADASVLAFLVDGKEVSLEQLNNFGIQLSHLESLAQSFKGVLAIELSGQKGRRSLSFYWQEEGELDQLQFNSEAMQALKTA